MNYPSLVDHVVDHSEVPTRLAHLILVFLALVIFRLWGQKTKHDKLQRINADIITLERVVVDCHESIAPHELTGSTSLEPGDLFLREKSPNNDADFSVEITDWHLEHNDLDDSDWSSISSNVAWYTERHGRGYHNSDYPFPIDKTEQNRQKIQFWLSQMTIGTDGLETCVSPQRRENERVLDLGTGTGDWVLAHAGANPTVQVFGVDIIPIQPTWVPSNCDFLVCDLEEEWNFPGGPFDRLFSRFNAGSFAGQDLVPRKGLNNLKPGGYLEIQDFILLDQQDETAQGAWFKIYLKLLKLAARQNGRPLYGLPEYRSQMAQAGYVDIVEKTYNWPPSGAQALLRHGLEPLCLAHLLKLGWTQEEARLLCELAERDMGGHRIDDCFQLITIYGRKPMCAVESAVTPGMCPESMVHNNTALGAADFMAQVRCRLNEEELGSRVSWKGVHATPVQ